MQAAAEEFQRSLEVEATASLRSALNPRRTVSLDGKWEFRRQGDLAWNSVLVPGSLQAQIPSVRQQSVSGEYRRRIRVPVTWSGDPWLVVGAADYAARITVNDRYVGFHEGGYTPFAFNLAPFVRAGDDALILIQIEDSSSRSSAAGYPYAEIPHGAQSLYGDVSGLWQSVRLEERNATFIKSARASSDIDSSSVAVVVDLAQTPPPGGGYLLAQVSGQGSSAPVAQGRVALSSALRYQIRLPIMRPQLWSPDSPYLYTLNLSLVTDEGVSIDEFADRFGMRKIEARSGKITLNGKPLFLSGALDDGYYPTTDYTVPSEAFLRDEFTKAKRLGLNLLRCHLKAPDPLYLQLADEMGLLVWYDLPNVDTFTPKSRARLVETLKGLSERDANHASLICVRLISDSRGLDLTQPVQRQWLKDVYDLAKKLYSDRLVIDNSAGSRNFHLKTDIASFETSVSFPQTARTWSDWLIEFAARPSWLFSPYGDSVSTGEEPLLVSGVGTWGLPDLTSVRDCFGGELPWWFSSGAGSPGSSGVEERFSKLGLTSEYSDFGRLARATQDVQLLAYKFCVEEIRSHSAISGYVWGRLADIQDQSDGLLDVCRNLKVSARVLPIAQKERSVVVRPDRRSVREGELFNVRAMLSNHGAQIPEGTRVECQLEGFPGSRVTAAVSGGGGETLDQPVFGVTAPQVTTARSVRVQVRWMAAETLLAQSYEDIRAFPAKDPPIPLRIRLESDLPFRDDVLKWLSTLNAVEATSKLDTDLIVCSHSSPDIEASLREGGRVLMFAEKPDALGSLLPDFKLAPVTESASPEHSEFFWFRRNQMTQAIPMRSQMQDWGWAALLPELGIQGLTDSADWSNADSGVFSDWIAHPQAVILRAGNRDHRLIVCTMPLLRSIGSDPLAQATVAGMIRTLSSPTFTVAGERPLF